MSMQTGKRVCQWLDTRFMLDSYPNWIVRHDDSGTQVVHAQSAQKLLLHDGDVPTVTALAVFDGAGESVCFHCGMRLDSHKRDIGSTARWCDNTHTTVFNPTRLLGQISTQNPADEDVLTQADVEGHWHAVAQRLAVALKRIRGDEYTADHADPVAIANQALRAEGL